MSYLEVDIYLYCMRYVDKIEKIVINFFISAPLTKLWAYKVKTFFLSVFFFISLLQVCSVNVLLYSLQNVTN